MAGGKSGAAEGARARRTQNATAETQRQREQERLVAEGQRLPGVAEALEMYGRYAPYVPQQASSTTVIRHSTGGNA